MSRDALNIETAYRSKPIPDRRFDWEAWLRDSGEDGLRGWGRTQIEAVQDLLLLVVVDS